MIFVQTGGMDMREFEIQIKSVSDVLTFVNLATARSFDVQVGRMR